MVFFLKKKKAEEKVKPRAKKIKEEAKVEKQTEVAAPKIKKERKFSGAWRVLKTSHVTEKATGLVGARQYVFKVWENTNKMEIKKAIEALYEIDVISVKIIKIPRKRRRLGRISGWRKGYKKAIIKIKEGQKIEVLPR